MYYTEHIPAAPLNRHIEKIWYCQADQYTATHLSIPLLHPELVFNFSEGYCLQKTGYDDYRLKQPRCWINGLQGAAAVTNCFGKHAMLGVLFTLYGVKAFTRYAADELYNQYLDADQVFGCSIQMLADQLEATTLPAQKINLVENYFRNRLTGIALPRYFELSLVTLATGMCSKGQIAKLCRNISITNKTLINNFRQYIGVSPGRLVQLQAVNGALKQLSKNPGQSLTALAYQLNFYDQAHFIRVFKKITSLTPSAFSNYCRQQRVDALAPNFINVPG